MRVLEAFLFRLPASHKLLRLATCDLRTATCHKATQKQTDSETPVYGLRDTIRPYRQMLHEVDGIPDRLSGHQPNEHQHSRGRLWKIAIFSQRPGWAGNPIRHLKFSAIKGLNQHQLEPSSGFFLPYSWILLRGSRLSWFLFRSLTLRALLPTEFKG